MILSQIQYMYKNQLHMRLGAYFANRILNTMEI